MSREKLENTNVTTTSQLESGVDFWFENVPKELRRLEYEVWKREKKLVQARYYRLSKQRELAPKLGLMQPFNKSGEEKAWENFTESFVATPERKTELNNIVRECLHDLPSLKRKVKARLPKEIGINLIALTGSSVYGPRKKDSELFDRDINFLLKVVGSTHNLNIMPSNTEPHYQFIATGFEDGGRLKNQLFHWLLEPFLILESKISVQTLKDTVRELVRQTLKRENEINKEIENLEDRLNSFRKPQGF